MLDVPESDWIIVLDTHEGIVDRDLFNRVQELLKVRKRKNKTYGENIFSGLLVCSDCQHHLGFHTNYRTKEGAGRFVCCKYSHSIRHASDHAKCTMHNITYKAVYDMTIEHLNRLLTANLSPDAIMEKLRSFHQNDEPVKERIEKMKKRDKELQMIIQKIIEQNALGEITSATFTNLYGKYNTEQETLVDEIRRLSQNLSENECSRENVGQFHELVQKYTGCSVLNRQMLLDLVDKIVVHEATGDVQRGTRQQQLEFHYRFIGQLMA